jgi:release factor glutamine methyltransferase
MDHRLDHRLDDRVDHRAEPGPAAAASDRDAGHAGDAAGELFRRHAAISRPQTFRLLGHEWDLLPGVYAPHLTRCAALYAEWIPYQNGGAFCEIGCGTGYIAVLAALRGCARVTATDVNPVAVENARMNAARHGVGSTVEAVCGDMFEALRPDDRYDVVLWNSSFVDAPPAPNEQGFLDRAFFDPGYRLHHAFLRDARRHLLPGGQLLLGFSSLGNWSLLSRLAAQCGWRVVLARAAAAFSAHGPIQYQLVRLEPA